MARSFSGTDRVVTPAFNIPATVTVSWWIKAPGNFALHWQFANDNLRTYTNGVSQIYERGFSGGNSTSTVTHGLTVANYNHMAWSHDGTSAVPIFYANGTPITGGAWTPSGSVITSSFAFAMGNKTDGSGSASIGAEAWVCMNNVVLSQAEVQEAMAYGATARGLIGAWHLGGASPEPDTSGNGRDGVVTGTTIVADPVGVPPVTLVAASTLGRDRFRSRTRILPA